MLNNKGRTKQEEFQIDSKTRAAKKNLIRQDRIKFVIGTIWVEIHQHKYEIFNLSSFGCAVSIPEALVSELQSQPDLKQKADLRCKIFYDTTETQTVNLRFVREIEDQVYNHNEHLWAFEVIGEPFDLNRLESLEKSQDLINSQKSFYKKRAVIAPNLKLILYEMRDWLENLKQLITSIEKTIVDDGSPQIQDYRVNIIKRVSSYLGEMLPLMYSKIPELIKPLTADELSNFNTMARSLIGPFVYESPFAARAYYKPRGYAGDYEMMNQLYRNEAVGNTLFDQCMHKYLIDEPAGEAVKNRAQYLVNKITKIITESPANKTIRIASIASGPAMEIQILLDNLKTLTNRSVEFDLIDQDEESLKHAQKQILSKDRFVRSGFKFNFTNIAIKNIIAEGLSEKKYDLIYSAGLFDYFSDPVAKMAAEQLYNSLESDGLLVIGNFNVDNPTTPLMETLLDWNLIYRSQEALTEIFGKIGQKFSVEIEPLKINLFANIRK